MFEPKFWRGSRVLVTGHTGFKGAWLSLWLNAMGARVAGLALPPEYPEGLSSLAPPELEHEVLGDIRDAALVDGVVERFQPEIVFHMAAQPLVLRSYHAPVETFATNVMGTAHLLDAVRRTRSARAVIIVTTDKVYENLETGRPFVETDRLGGHDPYSASKACTELVTASFRSSYFKSGTGIASARAGNVIGGGDWAKNRIVPDVVRAVRAHEPVRLRYPAAVRPWQHVLEPLGGYLMLAQSLSATTDPDIETMNFAPDPVNFKTVAELVDALSAALGTKWGWQAEPEAQLREAELLTLSADRAHRVLGWRPMLNFDQTVEWTASWYGRLLDKHGVRRVTNAQIAEYMERLTESSKSRAGAAMAR